MGTHYYVGGRNGWGDLNAKGLGDTLFKTRNGNEYCV